MSPEVMEATKIFPPPVSLKFSRDDRRIVVYFLSEVSNWLGFFELGLQKQWGSLGMIGDVLGEQSSFGTDEDFLKDFSRWFQTFFFIRKNLEDVPLNDDSSIRLIRRGRFFLSWGDGI